MGAFFWLAFSVFGKCAISLFPPLHFIIICWKKKLFTKGMKNGKEKEKYFKDFRFQLLRFSKNIFFFFSFHRLCCSKVLWTLVYDQNLFFFQNGTRRQNENLSNWRNSISLKLFLFYFILQCSCRCNVQCNKFSRIKS